MKSKIIEAKTRHQRVNEPHQSLRSILIYSVPLCLVLAVGCKKSEPAPPATQPAAVPVNPTPPVPAKPVPSFSAAQKIGMFVYPKSNQTHDQQLIDESECYNTVQQQTGIDPEVSGPQAPSAADVSAAQQQGAAQAEQAQGWAVERSGKGRRRRSRDRRNIGQCGPGSSDRCDRWHGERREETAPGQ